MKRFLLFVVLFLLLFASVGMGTFSRLSAGGKLNKDQFFNLAPLPIPAPTAPINDSPCSAIFLPTHSVCSLTTYSNLGATDSGGLPSCGNYQGGDVWFKADVPSSGEIKIELYTSRGLGWLDKANLVVYQGSCASLIEIGCYTSSDPFTNTISDIFTGRTPGETLFFRVFEHGNNELGNFQICVSGACADITVDAGLNDTICKSALSYAISGTSSANTSSVTWTTSGDGGFDNSSQENPIYTLGSNDKNNGSVTLTKTGYNSLGCSDVIDEMILTISPDPIAEAGDDDVICETELSYTFSGPTSSNGDIQWSTTGAGTFNDATLENPTYTFDLSDSETLTFTKTVSVNGCSNANNMDLTISESTIAIAGSGGESCDVNFTFDATTPSVGIGTWSIVSKPLTGGILSYSTNNNDPKTTVTVTAPGDYEFAWTVVNGACTDADTIGVVFIQNIFSVPGPNSNVCDTKIGRLTVISNSVGTPHWSLKSGPGTADIKTPNSFESDVEVSVFGLYEFTLTVTSGSCSVSNDMQIEFHKSPVIDGVVDASICKDSPSYEITGSSSINATDILWSTSGNGTFDDVSLENPIYTIGSSDISTVTLTKTVSNIGCTPVSADMILTIAEPSTVTTGLNDEVCSSANFYKITGSTSTNASSILWTSSGPGTFDDDSAENPIYIFDSNESGIVTLTKTVNNLGCSSVNAEMLLTITPAPEGNVGVGGDACGLSYTLAATVSVGTGTWSQVAGPVGSSTIFSAINSGSSTATASEYGTYVYRWTISNGICTPFSADITVNFYETPSTATVGANQDICSDLFTTSLGGNTPSVGTGTWSQVAGPVGSSTTFSAINSGSSTATASEYGTYVYRWTISNGTCSSTHADVTVNFYETPITATVGANQDQCATLISTNLGGNTPSVGTGTWSQVAGPVGSSTVFSAINSGSSTATASEYGTYVYRWTISNGTCSSTHADVTVNFYETPSTATVGANQDICSDLFTTSLGGNTPVVGIGTWSQVAGPVGSSTVFSAINSGSSTATASEYGTYVYRWTISNGICTPFSADITVNFYETPSTATVGANQDICSDLFTTSLGGNTPSVGTGTWSQVAGPVGSSTTFSAINSGSSTATASEYGTYVYRWTISNGTCSSTHADVTVNFYETPSTATVGANQDQCATLISTNLGGNTPSVGTGTWSQVAGPVGSSTVFSAINSGSSTATASEYGTYVYRWTISNGTCSSTHADVTVNFYETPSTATVGANQDICSDLFTTSLGGNTPSVGIGTWSQVAGPVGSSTTFSAINSGSSTATASAYGTYVYRWTISNGTCSSTHADVTVNFYETPITATVGANQDQCATLISTNLGGNTPSVGTGTWSQVAGPVGSSTVFSAINSGSSTATASEYGTYVYRWIISNGICSSTHADVTVNFYETPSTATVGANQDICSDLFTTSLGGNTPSVGTGTWSQVAGPVGSSTTFSAINSGSSTATASEYGTYVYRWTISNGTCSSTHADVTVNFYETPSTATVGANQDICSDLFTTSLGGNTPSVGIGTWSQVAGPVGSSTTFSAINSGSSTATASAYGTYVYRWTISNGTCSSTHADVTVNFYETPITATVGANQDQCATLISTNLGGNTPSVGTGTWSQVAGPVGSSTVFSAINSGSSTATASEYGTYVYRWIISNGICSSTHADVTVNFYETPSTATVGANQDICSDLFTTSLGGNTPSVGTGTWSQVAGPVGSSTTFSAINSGSSTATASAYGTYVYRWTISNGTCSSTHADVTVNFYETPSTATVGANQDICSDLFSASLGGNTPVVGTGTWSQVAGPVGSSTVFSAINSGSSTATASEYGTYVYRWTISNGSCSSNSADITVTYYEEASTASVGVDQYYCDQLSSGSLEGNTPTIGNGSWSQISGPSSSNFSMSTSGNTTVTTSTYGTYVYQWTITNGACVSSDNITVNYNQSPISYAGEDETICGSSSYTVTGSTSSNGNIVWSTSGTGTFNDTSIDNPTYNFGIGESGVITLTKTVENPSCSSASDDINITFTAGPSANAGIGGSECDLDFMLSATTSIGIGTWTKISGLGNAVFNPNANTPNATVTVDVYDTYQFAWTEVNDACTDSDTISVSFYQQPLADAGVGGDECDFDYNLLARESFGIGTWTKISGSGNLTFSPNENAPNAIVTTDTYGSYKLRWTEVNGPCTDYDEIIVNFYQQPIANAGVGGDECDLNFAFSAIPSAGSGKWTQVSGSGTSTFFPNNSSPKANVSVSAYGSYQYLWSETNGNCTDSKIINVNFYKQPIANTRSGGDVCGLTYTVEAIPSFGDGIWTKVSGPGNVSFLPNSISSNCELTVDSYGTYSFRWTENNGTCFSSDEIIVNFHEQPVANAGYGAEQCGLEYSLEAIPSVGLGVWKKISGVGNVQFIPNSNSPNALVKVDTYGTYQLMWTETSGNCSDSDIVEIAFQEQPIANAGTDIKMEFAERVELNAVLSTAGTGQWTVLSGSANLYDEFTATTSVDQLGLGENILRWTETNQFCSDYDDVKLSVDKIFIPSVITPNGDGKNEFFIIRGTESLEDVNLIIFNRNGIEIFTDSDYKNNWYGLDRNGNELVPDTYFYVLKLKTNKVFKGCIVIKR